MADTIEPHVARIVRDKTIKKVRKAAEEFQAQLLSDPPRKSPSPRKSVKFLTDFIYERAKSKKLAIFKCVVAPKSPKKNMGFAGVWMIFDGALYAIAYQIRGFPIPEANSTYEIRVRNHALERVSERLNTIDDVRIREELSSAVGGICISMFKLQPGDFYAKSKHGVALVRKFEDETTVITTWISNEMLKDGQIEEDWLDFSRATIATFETSNRAKIYLVKKQGPDQNIAPDLR